MAAKIFRINYKSDFILTMQSDAGWATPFCIKFWTGAPSIAYFAGWDGTTYIHCALDGEDPTKLHVQFDDHHLPIGDLKFQIAYHFTVEDFPNNTEDEVINQAAVIIDQDGTQMQVMLDLNGETAPEIEFNLPAYANEAQRIANENQRIANEAQRIANEEQRIANEEQRISNEEQRIAAESIRIANEESRISEFAQLKHDAEIATADANAAATLANEKAALAAEKAALSQAAAELANAKATLAQQKADYAQAQGDYAKAQGDYAKDQGNIAEADHERAESDHTRAENDHTAVEVYVDSLGAFDISAYHATGGVLAKYVDLSAALDGGDNIPEAIRKGGMSVKFVQSSDNKYVQYRLMHPLDNASTAADDFTNTANWQGVDDEPTAGSDNLVKSGGVSEKLTELSGKLALGAVYDISAENPTAGPNSDGKWETLSTLLSDANLNTLIPTALRKGGMSIKFIQSSDNKYVQYRLMSDTFNTTPANWQSLNVDDVPTADSENLVESGGVANVIEQIVGADVTLLSNITTEPGKVYITSDMVSAGDVLVFELQSLNNLIGVLRADKTGYVFDDYITVNAGETATVNYTVPADFLRIYTLTTANPMLVTCTRRKKGVLDEVVEDIEEQIEHLSDAVGDNTENIGINTQSINRLSDTDKAFNGLLYTEECIRIFSKSGGSYKNKTWAAESEDVEPSFSAGNDWYITAFDTIGASSVIVTFNALVEGYAIACYDASGTFIKNIHTSKFGTTKPNGCLVSLPDNCAVILIKHAGYKVSCLRRKTATENQYFEGGGRMAEVIHSIKIRGINSSDISQYFVYFIIKNSTGGGGSRFVISKTTGSSIQCLFQADGILSGEQTIELSEYNSSGVNAEIYLNMDSMAVASQSLSALAEIPSDYGWNFNYTFNNPLYLKESAFDELVDNSLWFDLHPGIIDKLPLFRQKLQENTEDINILMLGDSFFALQETAPVLNGIENLPPNCNRKHIQYYIWDRIVKNKPQCDRWDSSINTFTENGTFIANGSVYPTLWDDTSYALRNKALGKKTGIDLMRYSSSANASVSFTWNMSAYEKLHFIFAKCGNLGGSTNAKGTSEATVSISQGDGKAEVWNGSAWVEANGYTFSQELTQSNDGYALVMFYVKLKFRKVTNDSINVSITNTANDGLLYYWGTERWNGNTIFITNIARGGFTSSSLQLNAINDVGERERDLVILEPSFTNDMGTYTEVSCLNAVRWFIDGKSYDGTTPSGSWIANSNLKKLSDDWSKFEVLCIIPHIGGRFINTDNTFKVKGSNINYYQIAQRYKSAITKVNLPYIGIDAYFISQAKADGLGLYESVAAGTNNYTSDDVHPNETGCIMYAKNIAPLFELS